MAKIKETGEWVCFILLAVGKGKGRVYSYEAFGPCKSGKAAWKLRNKAIDSLPKGTGIIHTWTLPLAK